VGGAQEFLLDSSQLSPRAGDATSALAGRSRFLSFALPTTKLRNPNGVEHPDTLRTCFDLSVCLRSESEIQEASAFPQRAPYRLPQSSGANFCTPCNVRQSITGYQENSAEIAGLVIR
jgi:hypothetical protein